MINENKFKLKKDGTCCKLTYCTHPELIENYEKAIADTTQVWECHHRLETHTSDGERRLVDLTREELIALGVYYDRPPEELIFITTKEHNSLHWKGKTGELNSFYGKHHSEETKKKISEANKGQIPWIKGKHLSEEAKKKISESRMNKPHPHKGHPMTEETKRKMSAATKGKHWKLVDGKRVWY